MVLGGVVERAGPRRSARVTKKRAEDMSVFILEDDTEDDEEWEMRPGRTSRRSGRHEGTDSKTSVRDKDVMKPLESVEEEPPTAHAMAREIEVWSLNDSRWSTLSSFLLFLSIKGFCKHWIFFRFGPLDLQFLCQLHFSLAKFSPIHFKPLRNRVREFRWSFTNREENLAGRKGQLTQALQALDPLWFGSLHLQVLCQLYFPLAKSSSLFVDLHLNSLTLFLSDSRTK